MVRSLPPITRSMVSPPPSSQAIPDWRRFAQPCPPAGAASGASSACSNQCDQCKSLAIEVSYFSASPIANQLRIRTSPQLDIRPVRSLPARPLLSPVGQDSPMYRYSNPPALPASPILISFGVRLRASQNAKFWFAGTGASVAVFCTLRDLSSFFKINSAATRG